MSGESNGKRILHFRTGVEDAGFSSSKTSNANNADATTVVRELIQNSFDAAKEINRERAIVRFVLEDVKHSELPGFSDLKEAFPMAVKTQKRLGDGNLPDIQKQIVDTFKKNLGKASGHMLSIQDNGVGLTQNTMQALLGDGRSAKASSGGGAHGYGHLTFLPASNLRLVYYGGISKSGLRVASGHCVLAPFEDKEDKEGQSFTKDGYVVDRLRKNLSELDEFLLDENVPSLIGDKIDSIKEEWGTGTVVIVPGFNFFKSKPEDLWRAIKKAAATNFFASFAQDEICVQYRSGEENYAVDKNNIEEVLKEFGDEKNAKSFISGSKALECYKVITHGEDITFNTEMGTIRGKLVRHDRGRTTRIDLCRNGMWIVYNNSLGKRLPELQNSAFSEFQPFHLVLLSKASDGGLHNLIREAEPPIHDQVDITQPGEDDGKKLKAAFRQIKDQLKSRLEKIESERMILDDILSLPIGGSGSGGEPGIHAGEWQPFERNPRSSPGSKTVEQGDEGAEGRKKKRKTKKTGSGVGTRTRKKSGNAVPFRAIPVPLGPRQLAVEIHPLEDMESGEIRFMIDQNMDETCRLMNAEPLVELRNIELNNKRMSSEQIKRNGDGKITSIFVPNIKKEERFSLKFDFHPDQALLIADDKFVALKAEIVKRKAREEQQ